MRKKLNQSNNHKTQQDNFNHICSHAFMKKVNKNQLYILVKKMMNSQNNKFKTGKICLKITGIRLKEIKFIAIKDKLKII